MRAMAVGRVAVGPVLPGLGLGARGVSGLLGVG